MGFEPSGGLNSAEGHRLADPRDPVFVEGLDRKPVVLPHS
jgi:hypothetical protein